MHVPPRPPNDAARVESLRAFLVLDTEPEPAFDDLTRLTAFVCQAPIAMVTLVDADRQWFKSRIGFEARETHRDLSFCAHSILQNELFVIEDAHADERFRDHPFVSGGPGVRFYAGVPLTAPDGHNLGTLCVADRVPRTLTAEQSDALRTLGRQVVAQLILRQQYVTTEFELREQETFRVLFERSSDAHLIFDDDGRVIDCNYAAAAMLMCGERADVLRLDPAALSPEFQPDGRRSADAYPLLVAAARQQGCNRFDWVHRGVCGQEFMCEVTLTPVELHGREAMLAVWHDLTDRKRIEDALRESEQRFRGVVDELAEAVVLLDADSRRVVEANPAFLRLLGYTSREVLALAPGAFLAADRAEINEQMARVAECGRANLGFRKYRRRDGTLVDVAVSASVLALNGRDALCLVARDVTAEKAAADALRASEAKFRATVDRLAEGVFLIDPAARAVVEANAAVLRMLGYTADEFTALRPAEIVADETPEAADRTARVVQAALARDGRCDLGRRQLRRKDGTLVPVEVRVSLLPADGAELHAVVVRDMTEQVRHERQLLEYQSNLEAANDKLRALAVTDALTGVKNRGAFDARLAEEFDRAARHGSPLSVVLLDVDHFKPFNDTFGHPAGDDVLRAVAAVLRRTARATDLVARYGGEEFVLILPETDRAGALTVAERCRRAVAGEAWDLRAVTVSVGVSTMTPETADVAALVNEADVALYRSKQAGRNRVSHGSGLMPIPVAAAARA
jgi:diguanylate cyclase (GGDEF)-like protein/PAS domain S-box-containing protein